MNPVSLRVIVAAAVPVIMAFVYFGLIASDKYVSESSVVIRSGGASSGGISLGGLLPLPSAGGQDVVVVADYIASNEMAMHLNEKFNLISHYSSKEIDFVSRLPAGASEEVYYEYMQEMINVVYEETSEIISIGVRAFEPQIARDINREIISRSEALINQLSERIAEDTLGQAHNEVRLALENAKNVSARLSAFALDNNALDPGVETSSIFGVIGVMEGKLSEAKALFAEKSAYLRESSAEMRAISNRIAGLQQQLTKERQRLANPSGDGMGQVLEKHKPLLVEDELARQRYAAALASLETARTESQQKKRYLATFVNPNIPTSSTEPDRLVDAVSAILVTLLLYAIFALCRAAVREHIDFAT